MIGGALIGGISGYVGGVIAGSGIPMANTVSIAYSSFFNSVGIAVLSNGKTPITMSFGVASYDFTSGEWGYLGKQGNSIIENISYAFGALANIPDVVSLFNGGGQSIYVNSESLKTEWWGHSSITDSDGNTLVSVGPPFEELVDKAPSLYQTWRQSIKKANLAWPSGYCDAGTWSIRLNGINTELINNYMSTVTRWDLLINSCVGHTTRALWCVGVPTLYLFHPVMLNTQLFIRQIGISASPFLYQIP